MEKSSCLIKDLRSPKRKYDLKVSGKNTTSTCSRPNKTFTSVRIKKRVSSSSELLWDSISNCDGMEKSEGRPSARIFFEILDTKDIQFFDEKKKTFSFSKREYIQDFQENI